LSGCRREKIKVLLAPSEYRQEQISRPLCKQIEASLKVLSASGGGGDVRHQEKSFSPSSEFRREEIKKTFLASSECRREEFKKTSSP